MIFQYFSTRAKLLTAIIETRHSVIGELRTLLNESAEVPVTDAHTRADLAHQRKVTQKFSTMLATVMNGKPLYDKSSGTAFFFDKPYVMNIGK